MSIDSDIARKSKVQEDRNCVSPALTRKPPGRWAPAMRALALAQSVCLLSSISAPASARCFTVRLPGSVAENADWVRRKVNTVYRFEAASYRIGLEHKKSGKAFDQSRGINAHRLSLLRAAASPSASARW